MPKTASFGCDFSINDSDLSGSISVNSEGDLSVIFNGPDIINGTAVRVKEESVILEFQGISERYSREETPPDSPAVLLYDALICARNKKPTVIDGEIAIRDSTSNNKFTITLNGMGFVTKAELDEITFIFTNHIEMNN